jgi:hypothetical protein
MPLPEKVKRRQDWEKDLIIGVSSHSEALGVGNDGLAFKGIADRLLFALIEFARIYTTKNRLPMKSANRERYAQLAFLVGNLRSPERMKDLFDALFPNEHLGEYSMIAKPLIELFLSFNINEDDFLNILIYFRIASGMTSRNEDLLAIFEEALKSEV